jgi:hypothetical protein
VSSPPTKVNLSDSGKATSAVGTVCAHLHWRFAIHKGESLAVDAIGIQNFVLAIAVSNATGLGQRN